MAEQQKPKAPLSQGWKAFWTALGAAVTTLGIVVLTVVTRGKPGSRKT